MTLDTLVGFELSVMKHFEAEEAAQIAKRQHPSYAELSAADYDGLMLSRLIQDLSLKPVILGKEHEVIVAVYEVPEACGVEDDALAFGRIRTLPATPLSGSNFIYQGDNSCFAAVDDGEVPDKSRIYLAFFDRFGKIMGEVAFRLNKPIMHRIDANHPQERFFDRIGYEKVHESLGLPWDVQVWEHMYEPVPTNLSLSEEQVAKSLHRMIGFHIGLPMEAILKQTI